MSYESDGGNSSAHNSDVGNSSADNSDVDNSSAANNSDVGTFSNYKELQRMITAKSNMIYDKATRSLDMGRLRAIEYKSNKFVCLPKA